MRVGTQVLIAPARTVLASLLVLPALLVAPTAGNAQAPAPSDFQIVASLIEAGRLDEAERELGRRLATADHPVARDLLGVVLRRQGRLEEAQREFRRAVELAPALLPPRQHLARLYLELSLPEKALAELRTAAVLGPLDKDLALHLAAAEASVGNLAAAEEQLESAAERFDSVRALLELARLQARHGDPREALQSLWRALELAPNSEDVLSALGKISLAEQAPVPAIRALEPLSRMHPTVAEYLYLLGVAQMQIGENDHSVAALERALELEPERSLTFIALGLNFNSQDRFAEAETALAEALKLDPNHPEALAALAQAKEGLGKLEAAEEHVSRCLEQVADHPRALLVLGKVRMSQGRYAEARDQLQRAVAADPESHVAHYQLSLAHARLGNAERSTHHLELYRALYQEAEGRLVELRTQAGLSAEGM